MKKKTLYTTFFAVLVCSYATSAQIITTIAGNGILGHNGDGSPATDAELYCGYIAVDLSGNIYSVGTGRVRMISPSGIITTIAGSDSFGYGGDGGPATAAKLSAHGVAVDVSGNIYIADASNSCIRKVSTSGIITTCVGIPLSPGSSGDGGPATLAKLNYPYAVALDRLGNLYIADHGNNKIRKVLGGIITTIAGTGSLYDDGDGGPATAAALEAPWGVSVDSLGNIYISNVLNLRKINTLGIITGLAGYVTSDYTGDGGPATAAGFNGIFGVAIDRLGYIYIADQNHNAIRVINPSGIVSTYAGTGTAGFSGDNGPAYLAQLNYPRTVAVDASGVLYIADEDNNRIRKVSAATALPQVSKTDATINLYPNPAQNELTLTATAPITAISITNPLGQTIYSANCNTQTLHINLSPFPPGIYFIKINGTETRKFVKQ